LKPNNNCPKLCLFPIVSVVICRACSQIFYGKRSLVAAVQTWSPFVALAASAAAAAAAADRLIQAELTSWEEIHQTLLNVAD
jgi:hypothetical protein